MQRDFVERKGSTFLVTNWHVLAGRHPLTHQPLSSNGAIPEKVVLEQNRAGQVGAWLRKEEALYDANGERRWLEHPAHPDGAVDVVALRLTDLTDVEVAGVAYDLEDQGPRIEYGPTRPLSIIGFPFGVTGGGFLAIWVQGYVATEPSLNFDGKPLFLIDSRTRSGQSGSHVSAYHPQGVLVQPVLRWIGRSAHASRHHLRLSRRRRVTA